MTSPFRVAPLRNLVGLFISFVLAVWFASPAHSAQARITNLAVKPTDTELQIIIRASAPVRAELRDVRPNWVVVDVLGAAIDFKPNQLPRAEDPVTRIWVGQFQRDVARIVVELSRPAPPHLLASPDHTSIIVGVPVSLKPQQTADRGGVSSRQPSDDQGPASYLLGPEDVLEISVWGHSDLTRSVTVRPDGRISLPLIGAVLVAGISAERLSDQLNAAFAKHFAKPNVTVMVKEVRKLRISILGSVGHPGTYSLPPGARLLEALSAAGGIEAGAAITRMQLIRPGEPSRAIDIQDLMAGSPAANVVLQGGETLVVPVPVRVSVLGQVAHPGTFSLPAGARILDALSAAGGVGDAAALAEAQVLRPGDATHSVNLERLLAGDLTGNFMLRGNETLVVPEDRRSFISVLGEVAHPGRFRLKGEMHLLDALAEAGGLTDHASVRQAQLVRGSQQPQTLNLDSLLVQQDMSQNIPMEPGDMLFIASDKASKFYVLGDVSSPGVFPLAGEVTLLQGIAMAGGPVQRGIGTARKVQIVRRVANSEELAAAVRAGNGQALATRGLLITMDMQAMMRGDPSTNQVLKAGDVVVVSETAVSGLPFILNILSFLFGFR